MSEEFRYKKPCAIGKNELAVLLGYKNPLILFRKIHLNKQLMNALYKIGYNNRSKILSPKEMEIICEYFGYPIEEEKR